MTNLQTDFSQPTDYTPVCVEKGCTALYRHRQYMKEVKSSIAPEIVREILDAILSDPRAREELCEAIEIVRCYDE